MGGSVGPGVGVEVRALRRPCPPAPLVRRDHLDGPDPRNAEAHALPSPLAAHPLRHLRRAAPLCPPGVGGVTPPAPAHGPATPHPAAGGAAGGMMMHGGRGAADPAARSRRRWKWLAAYPWGRHLTYLRVATTTVRGRGGEAESVFER